MIIPATRNLQIFKNAVFDLSFALQQEGVRTDLSSAIIRFRATDHANTTTVIDKNSADSPTSYTFASDYLVTFTLTEAQTLAITQSCLMYQLDISIAGDNYRYLVGNIDVYDEAAA